jgi:hypothetical protein
MAPGNATDAVAPQPSHRVLLVSVPRTASNLLMKILNVPGRPDALSTDKGGYFFFDPWMLTSRDGLADKPLGQWSPDQVAEVRESFQKSLDSIEEWSARARDESKMLVAKEHAFWFVNPAAFDGDADGVSDRLASFRLRIPEMYGPKQTFSRNNHTVMSDEYLRTWRIAMIIRHPALAFPSLVRAMSKLSAVGFMGADGLKTMMGTNMTLRWTRMLYDWCEEQPDVPIRPLLVDASDVIHHPQVVARFCEEAGLDPNALQFDWGVTAQQTPDDTAGPKHAEKKEGGIDGVAASIMLSTLRSSTGIVKDKAPTAVDITAEAEKWQQEFGDETAAFLKKAVLDAMPDYDYLMEKRLTA